MSADITTVAGPGPCSPLSTTLAGTGHEGQSKMNEKKSANIATMPAEILLEIFSNLKKKRDWITLATTCRSISRVAVAELDKYNTKQCNNYALWYACVKGNFAILDRLITPNPKAINYYFTKSFEEPELMLTFGKNMTPLSVAILAGRHDVVAWLLKHGADANLCDKKPVTTEFGVCLYPINWAAASTHISSVSIIAYLAAHGADLNRKPHIFRKLGEGLEYPKGICCAPIFQVLLLDHPCPLADRSKPKNPETYNSDLKALQALRLAQLRVLLAGGADINARYSFDAITPMFFLLDGLMYFKPVLHSESWYSMASDKKAQAALITDIAMSFFDVLRAKGANVRELGHPYFNGNMAARQVAFDFPELALHYACRLPDVHKPTIFWFLDHGIGANALSMSQATPLMGYCHSEFEDMQMLTKFICRGAGAKEMINRQDVTGRTPLHELAANPNLTPWVKRQTMKILFACGAKPDIRSRDDYTPIDEVKNIVGAPIQDGVVELLELEIRKRGGRAMGSMSGKSGILRSGAKDQNSDAGAHQVPTYFARREPGPPNPRSVGAGNRTTFQRDNGDINRGGTSTAHQNSNGDAQRETNKPISQTTNDNTQDQSDNHRAITKTFRELNLIRADSGRGGRGRGNRRGAYTSIRGRGGSGVARDSPSSPGSHGNRPGADHAQNGNRNGNTQRSQSARGGRGGYALRSRGVNRGLGNGNASHTGNGNRFSDASRSQQQESGHTREGIQQGDSHRGWARGRDYIPGRDHGDGHETRAKADDEGFW
ncbi:ankyrin repeat-containing domain protein [Xylaria intraflava]|nr:ankyrin repeat-containing domain protein [Xylaria intraflava]